MKTGRKYSPEDLFGALLLIGALSVFGLFNFQSDEPLVEAGIRAQSAAITAPSVHGLRAVVDGRDITLTGLADSEEERDATLTALRNIEGRGKVRAQVEVLAPADPYRLTAELSDAALRIDGAVPSEALREDLRSTAGAGVDALVLASGAPDAEWGAVLQLGLRALQQLQAGRLTLEGRSLRLVGTALTPDVEARALLLLEGVPEGYGLSPQITVLDDGSPLRLTAARSDGGAPVLKGKLPEAVIAALPAALSTRKISRSPVPAPFEGWDEGITTGLSAMTMLQSAQLAVVGTSFTLTGEAWSQDAHDAASAALATLPAQFQVSIGLVLADSGAPFRLELSLDDDQATASGKVPRSLAAPVLSALIGVPVEATGLEIARIAPDDSWWQAAALAAQTLKRARRGEMSLGGSTLEIRALVSDPRAAEAFRQELSALPENISLTLDIDLIDDGTPMRLTLLKGARGVVASGKWPATMPPEALSERIGEIVEARDIITTPNPGPANWQEAALTGAQALALFTRGQLMLSDTKMRLTGTLLNPARETQMLAVLARLPDGYSAQTELRFQDDGRPFAFRLDFDGRRALLSGKIPSDLGPASQSAILGFPVEAQELELAAIPADADWWSAARAALKALALLQSGSLSMDAHQITLTGTTPDPAVKEALTGQLAALTGTFKLTLDITVP